MEFRQNHGHQCPGHPAFFLSTENRPVFLWLPPFYKVAVIKVKNVAAGFNPRLGTASCAPTRNYWFDGTMVLTGWRARLVKAYQSAEAPAWHLSYIFVHRSPAF